MKLPPLNSQKSPQQSQPNPLNQCSSQQIQIDQAQVQMALQLLSKLKKIDKKGKLSQFKRKDSSNNKLFAHMSQFFHQKSKVIKQDRKSRQQRKKAIEQMRYKSKINIKSVPQPITEQDLQSQTFQFDLENIQDHQKLKCHICSIPYHQIHSLYGSLCSQCALFNEKKRNQNASMKGLTALVTGGRIKIGFQICLKLLREGAIVYVTSRFPNDTLLRYQKEADYNIWKQNLFIIQCDFLSQAQVASLVNYIRSNVSKLDILINNAAQTIVRPIEFYSQQLKNQSLCLQNGGKANSSVIVQTATNQITLPSLYSNIVVKPGQIDLTSCDEFGQPLDKRVSNSWVQKIQDVSLLDCYTTQVINSIVPFYLISKLKNIMIGQTPSWVINVSSMEGVFSRKNKQFYHPHTNMAKASLNMITRTSASQFKDHNIFMNSVDTGWVTNQNPYLIAQHMFEKHRFKCPLDCLDGAMRVLDPIYQGLLEKKFPFGQILKNYQPSSW